MATVALGRIFVTYLLFERMPCGVALGFRQCGLTQIHLGVALPGVELEGTWPTREAINDEISFARKVLHEQLEREFCGHP